MSRFFPSAGCRDREEGMVLLYFVFLLGMLALLATMLSALVLPGASAPIDVVQGARMQARIGTARNILLAYSEREPDGTNRSMTRENCLMLDEARVSLTEAGQGSWSFRPDAEGSCRDDASVRFKIRMDADGAGEFEVKDEQLFYLKDGDIGLPGRQASGVERVQQPASGAS